MHFKLLYNLSNYRVNRVNINKHTRTNLNVLISRRNQIKNNESDVIVFGTKTVLKKKYANTDNIKLFKI